MMNLKFLFKKFKHKWMIVNIVIKIINKNYFLIKNKTLEEISTDFNNKSSLCFKTNTICHTYISYFQLSPWHRHHDDNFPKLNCVPFKITPHKTLSFDDDSIN